MPPAHDALLIVPPVAKACEPPAGIARLAAVLRARGLSCRLLDANLEGQTGVTSGPACRPDGRRRRLLACSRG